MSATKKPLTFDIGVSPATPMETQSQRRAPKPPQQPAMSAEEVQQIGARIAKSKYRALKARAALEGAKVQDLVEQAIDEFLAKPPG